MILLINAGRKEMLSEINSKFLPEKLQVACIHIYSLPCYKEKVSLLPMMLIFHPVLTIPLPCFE